MAPYDWDTMDWEQTSVSRFEGFSEAGTILEGVVHDYSPDTGAVDSQQNVCGYIRKSRIASMTTRLFKPTWSILSSRTLSLLRLLGRETLFALFSPEKEKPRQGQSPPKYYDVFMVRDPSVGGISDEAFSNRLKNSLEGQRKRLGDEIVDETPYATSHRKRR